MQFVTVLIFAQLNAFASGTNAFFHSFKRLGSLRKKKPDCKVSLEKCEKDLTLKSLNITSLEAENFACNRQLNTYNETCVSNISELDVLRTQLAKEKKEVNALKGELEMLKHASDLESMEQDAQAYVDRNTPSKGTITQHKSIGKHDASTTLSKKLDQLNFDPNVASNDFRTHMEQRAQENFNSMARKHQLSNELFTQLQKKIIDDFIDYVIPRLEKVKAEVKKKDEWINRLETKLAEKNRRPNERMTVASGQLSSEKRFLGDLKQPSTIIKHHHTWEKRVEKLNVTTDTKREITTIITQYVKEECNQEKDNMINELKTQLTQKEGVIDNCFTHAKLIPQLQSIKDKFTAELNRKDEIINTLKTQLAQKDVDNSDLPKGQSSVHHYTKEELIMIEKHNVTTVKEFNIIKTITQKCKNEQEESNKMLNELKKELADVYSQLSLKDAELAQKDLDSSDLPKSQSSVHHYTKEELIMIEKHNVTTVKEFNIIKTITQKCKNEQEESNKMLNELKKELADVYSQLSLKDAELAEKDLDSNDLPKGQSNEHRYTKEERTMIEKHNISTVKEFNIIKTITQKCKNEHEESNKMLNTLKQELADTQYQLSLKEFELEVKDTDLNDYMNLATDQSSLQKQLLDQLKRPITINKHHHTREELIKELNITTVKELRITKTIIKFVKEECQEEKNDILNSRTAEAPSAPAGPSTEAADADSPAATEAVTHDLKKQVKKMTSTTKPLWRGYVGSKLSDADRSELAAKGKVRSAAEKDEDEKKMTDRRVEARTKAKSTTATRKQTSIDVE